MQYEFADLINDYSVDAEMVHSGKGTYSGGEYVPGAKVTTPIRAAIITLTSRKIYESGGHYSSEDREMYILAADDPYVSGADNYVIHDGKTYKVEENSPYSEDYADFNHYGLKRVDSFD